MEIFERIDNTIWKIQRRALPSLIRDWPIKYRAKGVMRLYKKHMGYCVNLRNPILFTEKLQYYKLYYDSPDFPDAVDKYLFKSYIEKKLGKGHTIPLYGAWETIDELRNAWDSLPNEFVLKSTLSSDGRGIKIIREKRLVNLDELVTEIGKWLNPRYTLINSFCTAYHRAIPRIIAEEYVETVEDQLFDYKAYCFSGEPHCFCASYNQFVDECYPITYYDLNWNKINVRSGKHKNDDVSKSPHFEEMIELSRKLSREFPFVRVDFFDTPDKLYCAELTFYPGGGFFRYDPDSLNKEMGDLFVLPKNV